MGSKIHCAHILVEKLSVAQDLKTRISKGESFANLAKEYSLDVSKKRKAGYYPLQENASLKQKIVKKSFLNTEKKVSY